MAATPPQQLREIFGRAKTNGKPAFDGLWHEALYGSPRCQVCKDHSDRMAATCPTCGGTRKNPRRIQWPYSKAERENWIEALEGTKESYRCGYLNITAPSATWVSILPRMLERNAPAISMGPDGSLVDAA